MEEITKMQQKAAELLKSKSLAALRKLLSESNSADIAEFLKELTNDELLLAFRILPKDQAADTFVEMEPEDQETLIRSFSDSELKAVLDDLFVDDTVDILEEMPANVVKRILRFTDTETRRFKSTCLLLKKKSKSV